MRANRIFLEFHIGRVQGLARLEFTEWIWISLNEELQCPNKILLKLLAQGYSPKQMLTRSVFKDLYFFIITIFIGKADIQRGETERKIFHPMIPQVSATANAMLIRSQEPLLNLPHGCRVPKPWADLYCFPGPQAGSWKGSGAAGVEPAPIWDPGCARQGL